MALTHTAINKAKPKDKPYKLTDQHGLYLLIRPSGSKAWKYDYRISGIRGTFTIGSFPEISLSEAREEHISARKLVAKGLNPTQQKQHNLTKAAQCQKRFSDYAKEWIPKQHYKHATEKDLVQRLEKNIYPYLDKKPMEQFSSRELLDILELITKRGAIETARRMAGILRHVYNDLLLLGLMDNNPAQGLAELLPKKNKRTTSNFGHITDVNELKGLLQQIHNPSCRQNQMVTLALKLMPLLFLRPKNIRFMKWEYIDFEKKLITIPGSEMKADKELKIPISTQAETILREAYQHTSQYEYVFVTRHGKGLPMSENTTTNAIKRMSNPSTGKPYGTGFMTSHGFRHTASTLLNEMGYSPDAIELQLAHEHRDRVRATYNKAQLIEERTKMMQEWADFIEGLTTSS